jgi:hypothetical protein
MYVCMYVYILIAAPPPSQAQKRTAESVEALAPSECIAVYQECLRHLAQVTCLPLLVI